MAVGARLVILNVRVSRVVVVVSIANGCVLRCSRGGSRSSCVVGGHTMHHHCLTNDDRMGAFVAM